MKKRIKCITLISILLALTLFVNEGYAFFIFGTDYFKNASLDVDDIYTSNASFDHQDDSYYTVYFFASPYYATGSGDTPSLDEDPLAIANSTANPYNSSDDYGIKSGSTSCYTNVTIGGYGYYISCSAVDETKEYGKEGWLTLYPQKMFSGYILANEGLGIEQTSTYVKLTVKGNISSEHLSGIIASSVYADQHGFGPEFCGWTYDKEETFERATYSTSTDTSTSITYSRYKSGFTQIDSSGQAIDGGIGYQIGNYGVQGDVVQVTPATSLEYIDSLTVDGSKAGDHVIYLYPAFCAKNYDKNLYTSSYDGSNAWEFGSAQVPVIKFRVNPGKNYGSKQSDEIDYSLNRYTSCLFYQELNVGRTKPNFYIGNFHYEKDSTIQLDFDEWSNSGEWTTLLTDTQLDDLGLADGYYNIDLTFWHNNQQYDISNGTTPAEEAYKATNQYIKISSGSISSLGNHWTCYYIIGFQKVEEFDLNVYGTDGENVEKTVDLRITPEVNDLQYYIVDNVYLNKGQTLVLSNSNIKSISAMTDRESDSTKYLSAYNDANNTSYSTPGINATDSDKIKISDNKISVDKDGYYSFIVLLTYEEGIPKSAMVAYKEIPVKYYFIVYRYESIYSTADDGTITIDETIFTNQNHDSIRVYYEGAGNTYLSTSTTITYKTSESTTSATTTIGNIYQNNYVLVDTATGLEIPKEVFENGDFYLNRSYILYLKYVGA